MTRSRRRSGKPAEARKKSAGGDAKTASAPPRAPSILPSLGLGALAGVLYFTAFPGIDVWPLGFVALVPLCAAIDREIGIAAAASLTGWRARRRWLALGLFFGLVTNLGGYYWLVGMLEDFSGFPVPLCLLFAAILCTYQGGLLAVMVALAARARARGWSFALVLPASFAVAELVYPLLFPSYYGAIFHDVPALVQIADLGGPMLVTALACLVNAAIYEGLSAGRARRPMPWRVSTVTAAALVTTLAYGAWRIGEVDTRSATSPAIEVGIVQTSMGIFDKWDDPVEGHRRHVQDTVALERQSGPLDLVVWPESAYTFPVPEGEHNVRRRVLGPVRSPTIFGALAFRTIDGRERHYNTAYLADETGEILGTYDKTYLLMFGEYIPFGDTFPVLYDISRHSGDFTPGDSVRSIPFRQWQIAVLVCYEDILPGFVRRFVAEGDPHLFVNITNDSWFGETSEPWQHFALAKLRAVEHHRWLVRSTNSGVSGVIDPVGRETARSGLFTRETIRTHVRMMTGTTVYAAIGDAFAWLCALAVVVMGWLRRRAP